MPSNGRYFADGFSKYPQNIRKISSEALTVPQNIRKISAKYLGEPLTVFQNIRRISAKYLEEPMTVFQNIRRISAKYPEEPMTVFQNIRRISAEYPLKISWPLDSFSEYPQNIRKYPQNNILTPWRFQNIRSKISAKYPLLLTVRQQDYLRIAQALLTTSVLLYWHSNSFLTKYSREEAWTGASSSLTRIFHAQLQ